MKLIGVNEHAALYMVEDKPARIDADAFIADLLDVRNAKHLIRLLIDHSDTITAYQDLRLSATNESAFHKKEPWFSEGHMRDAADSFHTTYPLYQSDLDGAQERFDSVSRSEIANRLGSHTDKMISADELLSILHSSKHEVVTVNLGQLHDTRERWESLLTFAAIGNGATPPNGFITSEDPQANVFRIHHEAIEKAMPNGVFRWWEQLEDRKAKRDGLYFGKHLHMRGYRDLCVFNLVNTPNDPKSLLRVTCGSIAAEGINQWCGGYLGGASVWQEVEYDPDKGYYISDQTDLIIDALRTLIVNDKVRLCLICGKPFIPKRKTKQYCSDVCKQKAFTTRKEGR